MELRGFNVYADAIVTLAKGFPSLETLTIDDCFIRGHGSCPLGGHVLFQVLGGLKNFHTLEFDSSPKGFVTDIATESGPSKLIALAALSKLRTLLVPVDFFVNFTSDNNSLRGHRTTIILPDSLHHLTLILDSRYMSRLSLLYGRRRKYGVILVVESFFCERLHLLCSSTSLTSKRLISAAAWMTIAIAKFSH